MFQYAGNVGKKDKTEKCCNVIEKYGSRFAHSAFYGVHEEFDKKLHPVHKAVCRSKILFTQCFLEAVSRNNGKGHQDEHDDQNAYMGGGDVNFVAEERIFAQSVDHEIDIICSKQ